MAHVIHVFPSTDNNTKHPHSHPTQLNQPLSLTPIPVPLSPMEPNPTTTTSSPEFEFRQPSTHQTTLHSADQLFSGGLLLPLHLLHLHHPPDPPIPPTNTPTQSNEPINPPSSCENKLHQESDLKPTPTASKRWKDIFKKTPESKDGEKKKKKKERLGGSASGTGGTELNINLWPFSRSRSAGNNGNRARTVVGNRKVSSAPCSRSNSTGDKCRRWPSSPGRVGVHLSRSSPVWQAKRVGQGRSLHDNVVRSSVDKSSRPATATGGNGKVLNINVPRCIGYRQRMGCQSDVGKENGNGGVAGDVTPVTVGAAGEGGGSGLFNLRGLFTKKVF